MIPKTKQRAARKLREFATRSVKTKALSPTAGYAYGAFYGFVGENRPGWESFRGKFLTVEDCHEAYEEWIEAHPAPKSARANSWWQVVNLDPLKIIADNKMEATYEES